MLDIQDVPFFAVEFPFTDEVQFKKSARELLKVIRPSWNAKDISFMVFTAGITNKIYCATYGVQSETKHEQKIIFRVFGRNTEKIIDRKAELSNWLLLADRGCAAPVYARFLNGLVCGYQPGVSLTVATVRSPHIVPEICRTMARMHKIQGFENEAAEPCLFKKAEKFLGNFSECFAKEVQQKKFDEFFVKNNIVIRDDFAVLTAALRKLNAQIVFCHNDLLVHNILYDKLSDSVSIIDYEYAGYNYQGFDIANHFCEYAGVEETDYSLCPSREEKRNWIAKYLEFYLERMPKDDEVERMLENNEIFEAASHFFWAIWALVQSQNSEIDFDYLSYAILRYQMFQKIFKSSV